MKLVKLSLAAMIAMSTVSFAADSLSDAFKNGTFNGELRSFYFDRDTVVDSEDLLSFGVKADYESATFYGFKAGFGFQSSSSAWAGEEAKVLFNNDQYGSGAVLSQAYLQYSIANTTMKLGRQYIQMPLLGGSGSRMIIQSFEGFTAVNNDLPQTTLSLGYVNKYQNRTDKNGNVGTFEDLGEDVDYAYAISAVNKSLPGTTLTAAYAELENTHALLYAEAKFANQVNSLKYNVAVQYEDTDYEDATKDDAFFYAIKLGGGIGGLNAYAAYADIQDGDATYKVVGDGTKPLLYTSPIIDAGQYDESEQYAFDANYNFKDLHLLVGARYIDIDFADSVDDATWVNFYAKYQFSGELQGLSTYVQYEEEDRDISYGDKEFRFVAKYKF